MFKGIFRLIFTVLLLAGWGLAALAVHVVRTPDNVPTIVPKEKLDFRDTYVDTTKWTLDDVANHPAVVEKLIHAGKSDVLKHVVADTKGDITSQLTDALKVGPTHPTTTASSRSGNPEKRGGPLARLFH